MAKVLPKQALAGNYYARLGTFVLIASPAADLKSLYPKVAEAIRADSRVVEVAVPKLEEYWATEEALYPVSASDPDELLRGSDLLYGVRYPQPFAIEISVPAKNQPRIHNEVAASDHYFVAWDGWTAVVLWEKGNASYPPASAGQVLIGILQGALETLDLSLYVQACSPQCELQFAHRAMIVVATDGTESSVKFEEHGKEPVRVEVVMDDQVPLSVRIHHEVVLPASEFSIVKNVARRIINLEDAARSMTSELIALDYDALATEHKSAWIRLRTWIHHLRHHRGESGRRRAKYLIACLWLAMASIEVLQRRFTEVKRDYEDTIESWATRALFEEDLKSDEANVGSVDAQFARAAVEYKSTRIDTRVVVISTIVAGLAGGVLGLVTALVTLSAQGAA